MFVDGLTLAGARSRWRGGGASAGGTRCDDADVAAMVDEETRASLRDVRSGLQWILGRAVERRGNGSEDFVLEAPQQRSSARPRTATSRQDRLTAERRPAAQPAEAGAEKGRARKKR